MLVAGLLDRPVARPQVAGNGDTNWRELASYVWQYYLPRTPVQQEFKTVVGYPLLQVWITQGWAAFGWLEIKFDPWVYRVLGPLTVAVFGAALLALLKAWRRVDRRVVVFLAAAPSRSCSSGCTGPSTTRSRPTARRSCRAATCSR